MADAGKPSQAQTFAVGAAIVLTLAAIGRIGLWPAAAPRPTGLNIALLNPLQAAGWRVHSRTGASDGQEVSAAEGMELVHPVQHPGVILTLVPVSARGANSFTIETLVRPVAGTNLPSPTLLRFGPHERARFNLNASSGSGDRLEAACLSGGVAMANRYQMVRGELATGAPASWQQRLAQVAGLRPTRRWDCLLVAVRGPAGASRAGAGSSGLWAELLSSLRFWDQPRG